MSANLRVTSGAFFAALLGAAALLPMAAASAQDAKRHLDPAFPNYQPAYPDAAQVNGEQGDVVLKVRVNEDGRVRNIEVERSSGFADASATRMRELWAIAGKSATAGEASPSR